MRKPDFCLCENKGADQLRSKPISAFVFAIGEYDFFLSPKFQVSNHFLRLYMKHSKATESLVAESSINNSSSLI